MNVTINSRKFDGTIHRSWKADLIKKNESMLIFLGKFENEVVHQDLGIIRRNTVSYEYYWLNRWYNIFRFHEPNGDLRNFYCNINIPPVFDEQTLDYIDLDLDILVWQDFSYEILDEDEYIENADKYVYTEEIKQKVSKSLSELQELIKSRNFPFSETNMTKN